MDEKEYDEDKRANDEYTQLLNEANKTSNLKCILLIGIIIGAGVGLYYGINAFFDAVDEDRMRREQYALDNPIVEGKISAMHIAALGNNDGKLYTVDINGKSYQVYREVYYALNVGDCVKLGSTICSGCSASDYTVDVWEYSSNCTTN